MSARDDEGGISVLRVPPHSLEAEQAVLGGLMLSGGGAWDRVGDILVSADFYRHEHRTVWDVIAGLAMATKLVDVITVGETLDRMLKLDEVGGWSYLNAMTGSVPSASGIRMYGEIVRDRAMQRKLIAALDEAMTAAWSGDSLESKLDQVASKIGALERGTSAKVPTGLDTLLVRRLDHITALHHGEEKPGWETFLPQLNALLNGGFRPGSVYVIAARPSVGKSALAAALGIDFAMHGQMPVLFLSQEMPEDELGDRALANLAGVDYGRIQTGQLQDIDWQQISDGVEKGARIPFFVDDTPALTLSMIRSKARQVKGLKILVLDYLQLSEASADHRGNRNGAVEEISRGLKQLAKEMGIAVILLSQLNRKVEERTHKRPILADLRDSGAIEQDADVVIFLFPIKELKHDQCTEIGLDIPKNRQGKKGAFALNFWGAHMRWGESAYLLSDLLKSSKTGGDSFE